MGDKSSMKITYYNKHSDSSTQQVNHVLCISFIKNLEYWNLSIHSHQLYVLLNMCHAKNVFEEDR